MASTKGASKHHPNHTNLEQHTHPASQVLQITGSYAVTSYFGDKANAKRIYCIYNTDAFKKYKKTNPGATFSNFFGILDL